MIPLESFVVLRRLTVGEVRIQPRRVKARYTVENLSGATDSVELIYSYEHPYFDRKNPDDVNLASMMLAQVALNYGLFCREIVFDGLFDATDRRFLRDMMENTSREIITNKLLVPNEFLKPPYNALQAPTKRKRYTAANLVFTNTRFAGTEPRREDRPADPGKYAILSSGGKDSLLTYGIVREIGEAFPVFINEAGRHWFTAVNAYRHFMEHDPNTEKPWSNSDRVFNWMLRHLPFIREDYASVRADMYPVRLWTVAVFLFGVLPVVRKKGIGNVLIGDEYDTTVRGVTGGISHYSGLFDQSWHFDNAMTRYYRRKGWQVSQYSILRSTSELLIMKILVKRYPELQAQQVSCHAAHQSGDRMYPCGRCEKCRRIIGMLMALDERPERCGYTPAQVDEGLRALEQRSVKQLGSDAAHLYSLLLRKGLIGRNDHTLRMAWPHPEITSLRFDKVRSSLGDLPRHVRKPLFGILSQYADGALERKGGRWDPVTLNEAYLDSVDYKLDTP